MTIRPIRSLCLPLVLIPWLASCAASSTDEEVAKPTTGSGGAGSGKGGSGLGRGGSGMTPGAGGGDAGVGIPRVDGGSTAGMGGSGSMAMPVPGGVLPGGGSIKEAVAIFDDNKVATYAITIAPADLTKMQADAFKNAGTDMEGVYVPATLKVDAQEVGKIGLRYKGAYGTLKLCFEPKTGKLLCPKLSMRVKINEFEMDKRWSGIKGINLHALSRDPTLLHERLGYRLFRDMGIPAPRSVHAKVTINGEMKGVFAATELVDGRFATDRFPTVGDGNLFKEVWPNTTDEALLKKKLKTNEDNPKLPFKSKLFFEALLAAGTNTNALAMTLDAWMGTSYMMKYIAVDRATTNWDGISTFYCGANGQGCNNHNFFLYEAEKENRLFLIPWDLDNTFSTSTPFDQMSPWNNPPTDCNQRWEVWGNKIMSPGCDPVFRAAAAAGKPAYQKAVGELLDGPFNVAKMQADLDKWALQITDAVKMDKTLSLVPWQGAVAGFKADLVILREKMQAEREGVVAEPFSLKLDKINDFEGVSKISLILGSSKLSNGASSWSVGINAMAPVAGKSDARADFEFKNDANVAWAWGFMTINMRGVQNLAGIKQIRFKTGTSAARGGRLEIESPKNTVAGGGRWGWPVRYTAGGMVTVDLSTIAIPAWANGKAAGPKDEVLANASGLVFAADPVGQNNMGFFPDAGGEKGFIQVDDVEFLK